MSKRRRLLTVGHAYAVAMNRRVAHELARVGGDDWEVTCVSPRSYHADLGLVHFAALPDEPCRTLAVPAYATRFVHVFAYGRELRQILEEPWDVVYGWEEPYVYSSYQLARWAPRRSVFTFMTLQNIRKRYPPPFSWFEKASLERADGWLYCGHSVHLAQHDKPGYSARPSRLGPLGVDVELFRPDAEARRRVRASLGWAEDGVPVIGFIGRFVSEKGVRLLMDSLDALKQPWRALFIGGGPLEGEIRAWASGHGGRVAIRTLTHDEVPAHVNALDLLCAPSETAPHWAEQFGRMLVEAFACGVAVIGSNSGEIPHVVGDAGVIVPERDGPAWTRAIDELIGDPERRRELGERGVHHARRTYAWPVVARAYLDFFEDLCEKRRQSLQPETPS